MNVVLIAYTKLTDMTRNHFEYLSDVAEFSDNDALVEYAARKCYNSVDRLFAKDNFVQQRLKEGHGDIAEHASFVFEVDDISVACLGQLTRHGLMSHSVQSSRYVDQSTAEFVVPRSFDAKTEAIYNAHCVAALELYRKLRAQGISKGDARYALPTGMTTSLIVSGNAAMWRNFLWQRCAPAAQLEIRSVAREILYQLNTVAPCLFQDIYEEYG